MIMPHAAAETATKELLVVASVFQGEADPKGAQELPKI